MAPCTICVKLSIYIIRDLSIRHLTAKFVEETIGQECQKAGFENASLLGNSRCACNKRKNLVVMLKEKIKFHEDIIKIV